MIASRLIIELVFLLVTLRFNTCEGQSRQYHLYRYALFRTRAQVLTSPPVMSQCALLLIHNASSVCGCAAQDIGRTLAMLRSTRQAGGQVLKELLPCSGVAPIIVCFILMVRPHQCAGRPAPLGESLIGTSYAFNLIYLQQHPHNCTARKYLLWLPSHSGIGKVSCAPLILQSYQLSHICCLASTEPGS